MTTVPPPPQQPSQGQQPPVSWRQLGTFPLASHLASAGCRLLSVLAHLPYDVSPPIPACTSRTATYVNHQLHQSCPQLLSLLPYCMQQVHCTAGWLPSATGGPAGAQHIEAGTQSVPLQREWAEEQQPPAMCQTGLSSAGWARLIHGHHCPKCH
jgi:hypothetical protein